MLLLTANVSELSVPERDAGEKGVKQAQMVTNGLQFGRVSGRMIFGCGRKLGGVFPHANWGSKYHLLLLCCKIERLEGEVVMAERVNYQRKMEEVIGRHREAGEVPRLMLHSCCAPCSSYVLEYLSEYFEITVFYYNPNIDPEEEYRKRVREQENLIGRMDVKYPIQFLEGSFDQECFYEMAKGMEELAEGGKRCFACYELRLRQTAQRAKEQGMDYFTTTLSISPRKNAGKLNEIGLALGEEYGVPYLTSDFKKKDGYRRSVELSKEYGLYRQDYCGCIFSKRQREKERNGLTIRTLQ